MFLHLSILAYKKYGTVVQLFFIYNTAGIVIEN